MLTFPNGAHLKADYDGLDFETARTVAAIPQIVELNIGHFLIGEAVFIGLEEAVQTMRAAMDRGRAEAA